MSDTQSMGDRELWKEESNIKDEEKRREQEDEEEDRIEEQEYAEEVEENQQQSNIMWAALQKRIKEGPTSDC